MDWTALALSLRLAAWTIVILLPLGIVAARALAWRRFPGKAFVEALIAMPLVLPPTVLGYYLLVAVGSRSPIGRAYEAAVGHTLPFTFGGLLLASVIVNIPFALQPLQRAFESVPVDIREAAWCSGMSPWKTFRRVELPLAWPGILSALALTITHTLGEFGVVLMIGGNIPGETKTVAVAIYDRVQAMDDRAAATMSALLLTISLVAIATVYGIGRRVGHRHA